MLISTIILRAQEFHWANSAGGNFQDPSNWTPTGTPSSNDIANLDLDAAYEISFPGDVANSSARLVSGVVTQNLSNATWSLLTDFRSGTQAAKTNRVIIANGAPMVTNSTGTGLLSIGESVGVRCGQNDDLEHQWRSE